MHDKMEDFAKFGHIYICVLKQGIDGAGLGAS